MRKVLMAIAAVLTAGLGGVIGYFAWPKDKAVILELSLQDITVEVGQTVEIEWWSSIDEAMTVFSIKDEEIAKITPLADKNSVTGVKVGETELTLVAKYEGVRAETTAKVTVVEAQTNPEVPNEPEEPEGGSGEEPDDTPQEDPEIQEEILDASEIIKKCVKCTFENNKLYVTQSSTNSYIQISGNYPEFEYDKDKLNITPSGMQITYCIEAKQVGEIELKIKIEGKTYKITVIAS